MPHPPVKVPTDFLGKPFVINGFIVTPGKGNTDSMYGSILRRIRGIDLAKQTLAVETIATHGKHVYKRWSTIGMNKATVVDPDEHVIQLWEDRRVPVGFSTTSVTRPMDHPLYEEYLSFGPHNNPRLPAV